MNQLVRGLAGCISFSQRLGRASGNNRARRRAMALVLVLVVVSMLSLAGYTFAGLMLAEREAALIHGRGAQARALADSGCELVRAMLALPEETVREAGGLYDNPNQFQGVLVVEGETPRDRGRFAVLAPALRDDLPYGTRFGLEDESTRLNLNVLTAIDQAVPDGARQILMALPGMTEDVADAILDWIDADDEPREFGAEIDYYSGLTPAYAPRNGPLHTVEELLLVRGVTPELLFGPDVNRNWALEPEEESLGPVEVDNSSGALNHGWAAYLTLYSQEANLRPDGRPKIDVNASDLEQLHTDLAEVLGDDAATFICAYRIAGPYTSNVSNEAGQQVGGRRLDLTQQPRTTLQTVLDLIGARVRIRFEGENEPSLLDPLFPDDPIRMSVYLPVLMDHLAVNAAETIPGRININQCSAAVLYGIPGMDPAVAEQILNSRDAEPGEDRPNRRHETWILAEGLVTLEEMKNLIPFICARGSVYRAQVVGYFEEGGPSTRVEAVFDATTVPARLVFYRDLSHLGRGFAPEALGIGAAP
ncbi:MAG: general secretion pathway protein GspK [Pirellulales bacterium]|nr:general secretion pathway protein GspK [Pirellulales bacterium]